jgi:hypothetical protein
MRSRIVTCIALLACCAAAGGCVRVERRATTSGVPSQWLGEWQGTWTSRRSSTTGTMRLSVRTFDREPLVQLDTTHPCLRPAHYRFVIQASQWRLLADGVPVFIGVIDPERRAVAGDYQCTEDDGVWQVQWTRALPAVADLGGTWTGGYLASAPPASGGVALRLEQTAVAGRLRIHGELLLPQLSLALPLAAGEVVPLGDDYLLDLRTGPVPGPEFVLQGIVRGGRTLVEGGILLVADPRVPFGFAAWSAARTGE